MSTDDVTNVDRKYRDFVYLINELAYVFEDVAIRNRLVKGCRCGSCHETAVFVSSTEFTHDNKQHTCEIELVCADNMEDVVKKLLVKDADAWSIFIEDEHMKQITKESVDEQH